MVRAGSAPVGQLTSRAGTPATVQPDGLFLAQVQPARDTGTITVEAESAKGRAVLERRFQLQVQPAAK